METPQQQTNLNFGQALELLKQGLSLQRAGWNGKGMYIFLIESVQINRLKLDAHLVMKTATGSLQFGWLPSQPDLLSEDWQTWHRHTHPFYVA